MQAAEYIYVWRKAIILLLYLLQLLHHFFKAQVSAVAHLVLHLGQPIAELFVLVIEDGPRVEAICDFLFARGHLGRGRKNAGKVIFGQVSPLDLLLFIIIIYLSYIMSLYYAYNAILSSEIVVIV